MASDLEIVQGISVAGAMTALLRDAFSPNIIQTIATPPV